jgi:hypothetical protein
VSLKFVDELNRGHVAWITPSRAARRTGPHLLEVGERADKVSCNHHIIAPEFGHAMGFRHARNALGVMSTIGGLLAGACNAEPGADERFHAAIYIHGRRATLTSTSIRPAFDFESAVAEKLFKRGGVIGERATEDRDAQQGSRLVDIRRIPNAR